MTREGEVRLFLRGRDSATLKEIYENVSFSYYHNWEKHLGQLMSRLIKSGKVERIKPGVFRLRQKGNNHLTDDRNQQSLF